MEKSEITTIIDAERLRDGLESKIEKLETEHRIEVKDLKRKLRELKKLSDQNMKELIDTHNEEKKDLFNTVKEFIDQVSELKEKIKHYKLKTKELKQKCSSVDQNSKIESAETGEELSKLRKREEELQAALLKSNQEIQGY